MSDFIQNLIPLLENVGVALITALVVVYQTRKSNDTAAIKANTELWQAIKDIKVNVAQCRKESDTERSHSLEMIGTSITHLNKNMESMKRGLSDSVDCLRDEVRAHNKLIDRTYALEKKTDIHDEKIRVVNHRISDLEENEK